MTRTKVRKDASQSGGELNFQTYQNLLEQRAKIDKDIFKLQTKFFKVISKKKGIVSSERVKYVPRKNNTLILVEAIRKSMSPNKEMTMIDILKCMEQKKSYRTDSTYFYTMVNNKLNRDHQIKKISRGVFMYIPHKKRRRKTKVIVA